MEGNERHKIQEQKEGLKPGIEFIGEKEYYDVCLLIYISYSRIPMHLLLQIQVPSTTTIKCLATAK